PSACSAKQQPRKNAAGRWYLPPGPRASHIYGRRIYRPAGPVRRPGASRVEWSLFSREDFSTLPILVSRSASSPQICSVFLYLLTFLTLLYFPTPVLAASFSRGTPCTTG